MLSPLLVPGQRMAHSELPLLFGLTIGRSAAFLCKFVPDQVFRCIRYDYLSLGNACLWNHRSMRSRCGLDYHRGTVKAVHFRLTNFSFWTNSLGTDAILGECHGMAAWALAITHGRLRWMTRGRHRKWDGENAWALQS